MKNREDQRSIKGTHERTFTLEASDAGGSRSYTASLSSELPVERFFGSEILRHDDDSINMARASRGLPLLFNHNTDEPLGKVRNIRIEGDKLRGELVWGKRAKAQEIRDEVDAEMLGDISIRYSIDEYETRTDEHDHDIVTVTRWTPLEASVVTVPADHTVGVGRSRDTGKHSKELSSMDDDKDTGHAGNETAGSPTVVTELRGKRKQDEERGAKKAIQAERDRIAELQDIFGSVDARFRGDDFDSLRDKCIADGIKADGARKLLLDLIQGTLPEQTASTRTVEDDHNGASRARDPFVQSGADAGEKLAMAIGRSIEERAGLMSAEELRQNVGNEYRGRRLADLARAWAQRTGLKVDGKNDYQMLGVVLSSGRRDIGSGTEDFTGILANVTNKQLLKGWDNSGATYQQWCRIGSLSDFRRANRTALSGMNLLDVVPENGEYKYGKPSDRTEYITAAKYGKLFSISREALLNDDLGAFTQVPMKQGVAAALTINKAVYDSLGTASGTGPTLNQTSRALFNTTDANYDASSGGITVANVDTGRTKMAKQADPTNGLPLNIKPKYLLVPTDLESTARVFVASEKDPVGASGAIGGATIPNPFYNQLTVIGEAYLANLTNGTTAWYLLADQNMHDTYEVGFVNGQQTPYLESKNGWDVDGVEYKVRIEAGIAALDFRGMYRKRGA